MRSSLLSYRCSTLCEGRSFEEPCRELRVPVEPCCAVVLAWSLEEPWLKVSYMISW